MSCENGCYEAQVNGCGNLVLKASLTPSTGYYLQLTKNNSSNVYQRLLTTDVSGFLTINKDLFPDGYFTSAFFNLKLKLASTFAPQVLTFNGLPYNCVLLHVVNTDIEISDTSPISTIQ